jgi:cytoskeleton protein RodZ
MIMENETTMINEKPVQGDLTNHIITQTGLGKRLRVARESMRISEKEAASRLRLNPKIIPIMENETFDNDLPPTFMRGYLRSYMRMLNIPEEEINATVVSIETTLPQATAPSLTLHTPQPHNNYRYLRWMTYVVAIALMALVSTWWASHSKDTLIFVKSLAQKPTPVVETQQATSTSPASDTAPSQPQAVIQKAKSQTAPATIVINPPENESSVSHSNNPKDSISAALDAASEQQTANAPPTSTAPNAPTTNANPPTPTTDTTTSASSADTAANNTSTDNNEGSAVKNNARSNSENNADNVYNDY